MSDAPPYDLTRVPQEWDPAWGRPPPDFRYAQCGIMYTGLTNDTVMAYLRDSQLLGGWGAIGKRLVPDGRGPWLPFNIDRRDPVRGVPIKDRIWPFCFGDCIWLFVDGVCGKTLVELEIDDEDQARLYVELATVPWAAKGAFDPVAEHWIASCIDSTKFARLPLRQVASKSDKWVRRPPDR